MDVAIAIIGLVSGIGGVILGFLLARILHKEEVKEYDYDALVLYDIVEGPIVLTAAKVSDKEITGVKIPAEQEDNVKVFSWNDEKHPTDYIQVREGDAKVGIMLCRIKGNTVAPILDGESFVQFLRDKKLVKELTDTIIKLQATKFDEMAKFFEEYKQIRDALFSNNIVKHVRAVGALCAKMDHLLDHFAEGYVIAKMELGEEDFMQAEQLKNWLENPQSVIRSFAVAVAEELFKLIRSEGGEKK